MKHKRPTRHSTRRKPAASRQQGGSALLGRTERNAPRGRPPVLSQALEEHLTAPNLFTDPDGYRRWVTEKAVARARQIGVHARLKDRLSQAVGGPINHPEHYGGKDDPYEAIKVIEAWGLHHSFCLGNVAKYLCRASRREDGLRDLRKAAWYLNREVERLTGLVGDGDAPETS